MNELALTPRVTPLTPIRTSGHRYESAGTHVVTAVPLARENDRVALAIVASGAMATSIGLLLPWSFQRFGSDPALGSGPVATIIQDVLSLLIYLGIAALLVGV